MKNLFYFLFTLTTLITSNEKKEYKEIENLTHVKLHFKDYNSTIHKSFISLTIENVINPIKQQLKILDNGTANYSFINNRKRELVFNYEGRKFSLIVSPNEELNVGLTIEELINLKSKFKNFKVTTGQNKITNNLILSNTTYLNDIIKQATSAFTNDGKSLDIDYKNKRISEMQKQLQIFESYIIKHNITDSTFINWSKAQIKYTAGDDLSFYPFFGVRNKKIDDEKEYFNFINEINSYYNDELTYHSYLKYMETLATSFRIIGNISNRYEAKRKEIKKNYNSNFPIAFNIIKKHPKEEERKLLMAYLYNKNKRVPITYVDSLKHYTSNKLLIMVRSKESNETETIISLIKNYDIPENEKNELLELYKNIKGKVIFHDFWFTNCAPCMKELPNYNKLISMTNNKTVEFIFYGVYMKEEEWKRTRDKFKLKGKHHLLSKNQLAFFERYFEVQGFPHHQFIKSNGKIGEKINYRVSPENFNEIKKVIKSHQ